MIRLKQTFGAHSGRTRELNQDVIRFGRQPSNDIAFDPHADLDASGNHAEIRREAGQWILVDLGSRNGTLIQGRAVQRHVLRNGDEIEFGTGGPRIKVEIEEPPRRGAPTAPPTPLDLGGPSSFSPSSTPAPQWSRSPSSRPLAPPPAQGSAPGVAPVLAERRGGDGAGSQLATADRAAIEESAARLVEARTRPLTYALIGLSVVLLGVICILGALVLYLMTR